MLESEVGSADRPETVDSTAVTGGPSKVFSASRFSLLGGSGFGYLLLLALTALLLALGIYCAHTLDVQGHHISGMNNQVVWGLPHVFAVSLIVMASGALNGATLASVFGVAAFKPYARLSVLLAVALLLGGLLVLVLDLGRPDRLIVALTHYNPKSIFSWNMLLYTGFLVICIAYLWVMHEPRNRSMRVRQVGWLALAWRIVLTSGTGCIFGFLIGRDALDAAILAPLFVVLSLVIGTAAFTLLVLFVHRWQHVPVPVELPARVARLQFFFVLALLYLSAIHHLTNLYAAEHLATEHELLSGRFAWLFWAGHVALGVVVPLVFLHRLQRSAAASSSRLLLWSSVAMLAGGWCLMYVVIIGAQTLPQVLFPGKEVTLGRFIGDTDGAAALSAGYVPSGWEWGLGVGGVAMALLVCLLALRVLPFVPISERAAASAP